MERVYELVADPTRHPEWWPTAVENECEEIGEGCRYRGVTKGPFGRVEEHEHTLERLEDCHEVTIYCEGVGVRTRFIFTESQGGTFLETEFSFEVRSMSDRAFAALYGKRYLHRWLAESCDALTRAAERDGQ